MSEAASFGENESQMRDDPEVDLIIPVYGGWDFVRACVRAALAQSVPARVIVVDDHSPDDTAGKVSAEFPEITLIRNATNLGFARSCNVGMSAGSARLVMLVNSDVVLGPNAVAEAIRILPEDSESRAGSAATLLLAPDGTVDSYGIVADATAAGFVRFHGAQPSAVSAEDPPVLGPYGAVAIYRRRALDEVGMFDTNIFMYGEELDLAFRLRAAGWSCLALEQPLGTHLGGASAGQESERQRRLSGFARGYLLRKYGILQSRYGPRAFVVEAVVTAARLILRRDLASLRGRWEGWHQGAQAPRVALPMGAVDRSITMRRSLRMRDARYWRERT